MSAATRPPGMRRLLHRFLPAHFADPVGLARRLLRSGSPEARFAMALSALGLAATPVDLLLSPLERRRYRRARPPRLPLIFVCGPPRSGTTVVAQTLIRFLPVAYLTNLTAVFPTAPLTAGRLFGVAPRNDRVSPVSYYGRTAGFWGPNDALHLWDRWLGTDRTVRRTALTGAEADGLARFFGACEALHGRPVLNKNNSLSTCAALVADALPTAHFVCMSREPVYLAQSLLQARRQIHGSAAVPYGVALADGPEPAPADPIEDVCRQVRRHAATAEEQRAAVGDERFWIVDYEAFCADPAQLVARIARDVLGAPADLTALRRAVPPLAASRRRTVAQAEFRDLEATLARLQAEA